MSTLTHSTTLRDLGHGFHPLQTLSKVIAAAREAMHAMHTYDSHRARGASHADAITRAFDAGYNT